MSKSIKVGLVAATVLAALLGGYFFGTRSATRKAGSTLTAEEAEYTCPMHPAVVKATPSTCPICVMELVKKGTATEISGKGLEHVTHVALSPTQQVLANVATASATQLPLSREVTCTGIVSYNQEKQGRVAAWVGGRLERLLVKSVGGQVRKGQTVAEIFSQDLYNAELQYLLAYKTLKVLNSSLSVTFPINTQMSLGDAHDRLRQLGFKDPQFEELQKVGKPVVRVPISSPFSGAVIEKLVQEGQYVNTGDSLFSIADLSPIWIDLELFESDFAQVKVGQEVSIRSQSYPGRNFRGRVKLIYPFLDPKTRTVRLRVELPNPDLLLKPDMYVTATIKAPLAASLAVPVTAVMDTGKRQVVWVESQPGVFLQREVRTGVRSGNNVQILSGLAAGEKVAVSGGYLIDSEAQLSPGETVPAKAPGPPPKKGALDMSDMKMPESKP